MSKAGIGCTAPACSCIAPKEARNRAAHVHFGFFRAAAPCASGTLVWRRGGGLGATLWPDPAVIIAIAFGLLCSISFHDRGALGAGIAHLAGTWTYNLANFLRSLREKLVKVGVKLIARRRYMTFQLAQVAVPGDLFRRTLQMIDGLRPAQIARC